MSDSYSPQKKCPPGFYSRSSSSIEVSRKQCKPSVDNKSSSGILAPKWDPKPVPSPTAKKRVDAVDLYVVSEVEPIMTDAITHLLLINPQDIITALHTYFLTVSTGGAVKSKSSMIGISGVEKNAGEKRKELLKRIDPIVTQLTSQVAIKRPDNIVAFLAEMLKSIESRD